jgi:hypothetical protein
MTRKDVEERSLHSATAPTHPSGFTAVASLALHTRARVPSTLLSVSFF